MLTSLGTLGLMKAVLELSYSEFSCSRLTLHLSSHWKCWPKQREATGSNNPAVPSSEASFWTYLRNWMCWEPPSSWRFRCCAIQSEYPFVTPRMKPTHLSIQDLRHFVLNISLTPKPPRTRRVSLCTHSWWALLELFTSYEDDHSSYKENRPPTSTTHTLPDHQLRRIFIPERIYNPMPTIGSDRGSVVCKVLRPLWSVLPKWRV